MKDGWQVTNATRREDNGFVTNITCVYAQTGDSHLVSSYYIVINEYNGINEDFIPFEELTEEIMLDWCFEDMGDDKDEVEEKVNSRHLAHTTIINSKPDHIDGLPY
jgi:hypothetical protein